MAGIVLLFSATEDISSSLFVLNVLISSPPNVQKDLRFFFENHPAQVFMYEIIYICYEIVTIIYVGWVH